MFPTTAWTAIEAARDTAGRARTLTAIARDYRRPLLELARRRGLAPAEAEDVVQELFARLVEHDLVRRLARERGRLRCYLAKSLGFAIAHHRERAQARKRGGDIAHVPLEDAVIVDASDPELDRAWRSVVLERAFARLPDDYRELVGCYYTDEPPALATLAAQRGTTVARLKALLHRARTRFRALVRDEVAATLGPLGDLAAELRTLGL